MYSKLHSILFFLPWRKIYTLKVHYNVMQKCQQRFVFLLLSCSPCILINNIIYLLLTDSLLSEFNFFENNNYTKTVYLYSIWFHKEKVTLKFKKITVPVCTFCWFIARAGQGNPPGGDTTVHYCLWQYFGIKPLRSVTGWCKIQQ